MPTASRFPFSLRSRSIVAGLLGMLLLASHASAGNFLIEFGETLAGDGPGGTWNKYGSTGAINGSTLKDSTGANSSLTFGFSGTLNASSNAGTSLTYDNSAAVGNPSWVASATNNLTAGDLFFTDNGSTGIVGEVVFTISGLTIGDTVSINFLGSRNVTNADGFYSFSLDGGANFTGFTVLNPDGSPTTADGWTGANTLTKFYDNQLDGYNAHRYLNASNVTLTGTTLQIKARDISTASGNFAALNAMQVIVVPEPASAAMLISGASLMLGITRRRRK